MFSGVTTIGCTHTVFGYLPTAVMLQEGGYKVSRFFKWFGLDGSFQADVESRLMNYLAKLRWESGDLHPIPNSRPLEICKFFLQERGTAVDH